MQMGGEELEKGVKERKRRRGQTFVKNISIQPQQSSAPASVTDAAVSLIQMFIGIHR